MISETKMNFPGLEFDWDKKPFQYNEIRKVVTAVYKDKYMSLLNSLEGGVFDLNKKEIESLCDQEIKKTKIHIKDITRIYLEAETKYNKK